MRNLIRLFRAWRDGPHQLREELAAQRVQRELGRGIYARPILMKASGQIDYEAMNRRDHGITDSPPAQKPGMLRMPARSTAWDLQGRRRDRVTRFDS